MFAALSSLSFAYPWVLFLLISLPAFYWLIRVTPPKPKTITFSAIQFLLGLSDRQETTVSTPWWLLLLRLILAALVIITVAQPRLNSSDPLTGNGPIVLMIDNDWAAAPHWQSITKKADEILTKADTQGRLVYVAPLAGWSSIEPNLIRPVTPNEAKDQLNSLFPVSWNITPLHLENVFQSLSNIKNANFQFITDGTASGTDTDYFIEFIEKIDRLNILTIYRASLDNSAILVGTPNYESNGLSVPVTRASKHGEATGNLLVKSLAGHILAQKEFRFEDGEIQSNIPLKLPNSLLNKIQYLQISGNPSAGSLYLMDTRNQRKNVGLIVAEQSNPSQALLSEHHYLTKALSPFYAIKTGNIEDLLKQDIAIIFMGDTGNLLQTTEAEIKAWVDRGGILVRFAGPKLANAKTQLTPVPLREGSRNLDGSISWSKPAALGEFSDAGPFSGLIPLQDITVKKQLLAIPSADLINNTWATLSDGTPLVTGKRFKDGHIILFHTTATPNWSNLTLSGTFVEMLRELGHLGRNTNAELQGNAALPPYRLMDGFGHFTSIKHEASGITYSATSPPTVTTDTPAGYYGNADFHVALNVGDTNFEYKNIEFTALDAKLKDITFSKEIDLKSSLLLMIILLAALDLLIVLYFKGAFDALKRGTPSNISLLLCGILLGFALSVGSATAQEDLDRVMAATLDTRLAYIRTGNPEVDKLSAAGLAGLSDTLMRRTSVETAAPMQVDPERHELLFYPFIYWPITEDFPTLSSTAITRINAYLKDGGTIVFDTRNQHKIGRYGGNLSNSPENIRLQAIVAKLQVPLLTIVPVDHVLTRSFYLMQSFPGRYEAGNVWVSATQEGDGKDGVSSIIIGSNDWAAAWASDERGRPLVSVIPDGERQREHARRFGVNLAMYTLTGSYKADQVHIPTILNRLSQ